MRKLGLTIAALSIVSLTLTGGIAHASSPYWAHWWRVTNVPVSVCVDSAKTAVKSVTGVEPTVLSLDANTKLIRGFVGDAGIQVKCTAAASKICNEPKAALSIFVFSKVDNAATLRDRVDAKYGSPTLIDCGPALNPL